MIIDNCITISYEIASDWLHFFFQHYWWQDCCLQDLTQADNTFLLICWTSFRDDRIPSGCSPEVLIVSSRLSPTPNCPLRLRAIGVMCDAVSRPSLLPKSVRHRDLNTDAIPVRTYQLRLIKSLFRILKSNVGTDFSY